MPAIPSICSSGDFSADVFCFLDVRLISDVHSMFVVQWIPIRVSWILCGSATDFAVGFSGVRE